MFTATGGGAGVRGGGTTGLVTDASRNLSTGCCFFQFPPWLLCNFRKTEVKLDSELVPSSQTGSYASPLQADWGLSPGQDPVLQEGSDSKSDPRVGSMGQLQNENIHPYIVFKLLK